MPTWLLALSYWLHLVATVIWLGGLVTLVVVARGTFGDTPEADRLSDQFYRRFTPLANLSLAVLIVTGLVQLVGEKPENYHGFLNLETLWAQIILAKHLVIALMVALMAYAQASLDPALRRAALLATAGREDRHQAAALRRRRLQIAAASLALGVVVLLLTAVATAL
jgi:putative copper export protein